MAYVAIACCSAMWFMRGDIETYEHASGETLDFHNTAKQNIF